MISVNIVYLTLFREITGKGEEKIEVEANLTLWNALQLLADGHGQKFREALFDPKTGGLRRYNHVTLNGQLAHLQEKGLEISLRDGDHIVIGHAISGG